MAAEQSQVWTLVEMARQLGVSRHRIDYIVSSRMIQPVGRVGISRLFDDAAFSAIQDQMHKIEEYKYAKASLLPKWSAEKKRLVHHE